MKSYLPHLQTQLVAAALNPYQPLPSCQRSKESGDEHLAPGLLFRFPQSPGSSGNSFNMAEVSEVLEVTFSVTILLNSYVLDKETKQKVQVHKEKTSFPLSQSQHREIDKTMRDIVKMRFFSS